MQFLFFGLKEEKMFFFLHNVFYILVCVQIFKIVKY